ncbi:hypothetical protein ACHAW5_010587 [Stephanodiscus triporus]|uniref:methylated-DNA--[protein]-cysteine S-methyltransferase n=1 Tax=Stephanodiscus triporus TaxID=2934178 RepID=A0ABD3P1Y0_9STRA
MAASTDDGSSLTPFQRRVYDVVGKIPRGCVRSYGSIAEEIGTSARAVGNAMGRNSNGPSDAVGGFRRTRGEEKTEVREKRRMLEGEGVVFEDDVGGGGGGGRIRRDFFVGSTTSSSSSSSSDSTRASRTAVEVRGERRGATDAPSKSKYFASAAVTEEILQREILNLLHERRAVLAREGKVDVMRGDNVVGVDEEYRGPIRLRLVYGDGKGVETDAVERWLDRGALSRGRANHRTNCVMDVVIAKEDLAKIMTMQEHIEEIENADGVGSVERDGTMERRGGTKAEEDSDDGAHWPD